MATFAADADLEGTIGVPVFSVHAINDPTAFVEMQHSFAQTMARGGSASRLVQVYTDHSVHSYLADAVYIAAAQSLLDWVQRGDKPTPQAWAARCAALTGGSDCKVRPGYAPAPLESRVAPRER